MAPSQPCASTKDRTWKSMTTRCYSDLANLHSFEERYDYLRLRGAVGTNTFGFDRYVNQRFYRSTQWKQVRTHVIARDEGRDLGIPGREIYGRILIHHMNPIALDDIRGDDRSILDPEFLICVTHDTHNAIHYGDIKLLTRLLPERHPGDTRLW